MVKKVLYLFMVLFIAVACNNTQQTENESTLNSDEATIAEVSVASFTSEAGNYVDQKVMISGIVNHTCKHSGKRMFIIDEGTEESVKIETGGNIDSFDAELEGSVVTVTGIVKEMVIDEAYLLEWEAEVMGDDEHQHEHAEGEESHVHAEGEEGHVHAEGEEAPVHGEGEEQHEHAEGEEAQGQETGQCENEKGESEEDNSADLKKIENLRNMIKESGKDHLSFYSIECISYEVEPLAE